MHALDKWIKENALSRKIFANKLKISVASLSRYLAGNRFLNSQLWKNYFPYGWQS